MACFLLVVIYLIILGIAAYHRTTMLITTIMIGVVLLLQTLLTHIGGGVVSWGFFIVLALILNFPVTRNMFAKFVYPLIKKSRPKMSSTEAEALTAGTVGIEGEVFSGKPNFAKILSLPKSSLSSEEQAFLDGPAAELCSMLNDFDITHKHAEIPDHIMMFIKKNKFFGMIIPKSYGGLQFSAYAHSQVITKISAISISVATTVSVPNSLGPAELLMHYGTKEQKEHYLPRLADGREIPCFALTSLYAGSDAASMRDFGVVCKQKIDGQEVLGIRLNWAKRYITLSPIATVLGLAFKCYDPDSLLGSNHELGITCALIPTDTKGLVHGRRHFPLNAAFQNGPTVGKDVFIPLDYVIGGRPMIGHGWRMLMECLAAGRAISLPSMVIGGMKKAVLAGGAYARSRRQFNTAIANFEGVQEVLARITGFTYISDAARQMTLAVIDSGEKPSVASAICKYFITDLARKVSVDCMDLLGGKGICLGPKNYMGRDYQQIPISITVEGANILTRSMIIFGQGAIRCHPHMLDFIQADIKDKKGLVKFTQAIFGYMGYLASNKVRSSFLSLTGGRFVQTPSSSVSCYYRKLTRYCASFAYLADLAMITLGGRLKFMESLSGRFADCFGMMYLGTAVLKHFHDAGEPASQLKVVEWAMQTIYVQVEEAMHGLIANFPSRLMAVCAKIITMPWGRRAKPPKDTLGNQLVQQVVAPSPLRSMFSKDMYTDPSEHNPFGQLCAHLQDIINIEPLVTKLNKAVKKNELEGYLFEDWVASAVTKGILTQSEADEVIRVSNLRDEFNSVDDFDSKDLGVQV